MLFYIASQDADGGILRCNLTEEGQIELVDKFPIDRPAYLAKGEGKLFALLREPFKFQSGVAEFDILPDGSLELAGEIQPTFGTISAHILQHRGRTYVAHYCSSSTALLPDKVAAYTGRGVDPNRQTCSHPHFVSPTPDGDHVCICDLGTDCIYVADLDLKEVSRVRVPAGSGPRHLVFSPDGHYAYCCTEMGNTVVTFGYENGRFYPLNTVSTLPENCRKDSTAAAIRLSPDGKKLWVSNRGHDSVAEFDVKGPELTLCRVIACHGRSPREMNVFGRFLLCGNELSHDITVFDLEGDVSAPVCTFPVTRPWCIL